MTKKRSALVGYGGFLAALIVLALLPTFTSAYIISFAFSLLMSVSLAYSWNFISGYTGYISFGQIGMFGIGAYGAALLILRLGMPWLLAAVCGAAISGLAAIPVGLVMLRLKGPYFAVGMLGFFQFVAAAAAVWKSLTNGATGLYLPAVLALEPIYYAFLVLAVCMFLGTWLLEKSVFGLRLRSLKEDEYGAEALGINTTFYKVFAFAISAVGCGLAGGIQAYYISYVNPETVFSPLLNLTMIVMVLFGGRGNRWGPLVGAIILGLLSEILWANLPYVYLIVYGAIMAFIIMFMPSGVMGYVGAFRERRMAAREGGVEASSSQGSAESAGVGKGG